MNNNDQLNNKNSNTKPSGYLEKPIIGMAYKEDISSDNKVMALIITSLAFGAIAIFTWCLLGLVSIITSIMALKNIIKNKRKGIVKWLALTGLGLGIINFTYYIIGTVYFMITSK